MHQTFAADRFASTRRPRLTRMPKIANLAATVHFHRTFPTISAHPPDVFIPLLTHMSPEATPQNALQTEGRPSSPTLPLTEGSLLVRSGPSAEGLRKSSSHVSEHSLTSVEETCPASCALTSSSRIRRKDVERRKPTVPPLHARARSTASDISVCQHPRSHPIVQVRMTPYCLQCGDQQTSHYVPASSPMPTTHEYATIAVGARPLLHTIEGFPFDLRCSGAEASKLLELPVELDEIDQTPGSFGHRQLALSRSNAQR